MATKVTMEALSPTMEEGRLVKWLKNEGDTVAKGDLLAEVETDKAVMELTARGDGVLRARLAAEGETRPVGDLLAVIAAADENIDALLKKAPATAAATATPVAAAAPAAPAARVAPATPAALQAPAPAPTLSPAPAPTLSPAPQAHTSGNGGGRARSSPLARRLATERGLDLAALQGSGPGGRVIRRDIEAAASTELSGIPTPAAARAAAAVPRTAAAGDFEDVPLTLIRKTIARRLAESNGPIPTFFLTADFDLTSVRELRARMIALGDEFKVSYNDILLKAIATALSQHPEVNAHWLGDSIRRHHRVHLGMAVAVEDGLITPIIADADRKRISEIARDSRELAKRARERKLAPEEYTGATATVSNLGMFGIDEFTAIIDPPEVSCRRSAV
jgi:pyruvate dehydrogenase E2 component (dihydrolipoamide acetyltransferase)